MSRRALFGRLLPLVIVAIMTIGLDAAGGLTWLDNALVGVRMQAVPRAPTGNVAIVDIDARSLAEVGTWPWPRTVYATMVDRLRQMGAANVAFDVDFSAASNEGDDAAFEAALARSGGSVAIASFRQNATATGSAVFTAPLPRFAGNAWPAIVNVVPDADGRVRSLSYGEDIGGMPVPSMAAVVAGGAGTLGRSFLVDFSIDAAKIDRISAIDVIKGTVDPSRIAGKTLIVGASAVELRDFFYAPVQGLIPGAVLQALGADTLIQGRALIRSGDLVTLLLVLLALAAVGFVRVRWTTMLAGLALTSVVVEIVAAMVQAATPLALTTAPLQAAFALLAVATVIREINARALRIAYLARFDPLTGLANRNQFLARLARVEGGNHAAMAIGLDRFNGVSETFGHAVSDGLLHAAAERLQGALLPGDLLARLDGDAFGALLSGPSARARAKDLAHSLIARVGEPYSIAGHRLVAGLSFGIADSKPDRDADSLLKAAETALHRAEATVGGSCIVFDETMLSGQSERLAIEVELWEALEKGEFEVYYQPQVNLADSKLIGVEALLRWNHPRRGVLAPDAFLSVAEAVGLIQPIGEFVLARACSDVAQWPGRIRVAVNVSPTQFTRGNLVAAVDRSLTASGLAAERLELEIVESLFIGDRDRASRIIADLHALGVAVALDDFGTGYSSLAYLRKFAIDKVKLDRSFIVGIPQDSEAVAIARAVGALARSLGLPLLAEGVEHDEQVPFLRLLGFSEAQGYRFGRPMRAMDLLARLSSGDMEMAEEGPARRMGA